MFTQRYMSAPRARCLIEGFEVLSPKINPERSDDGRDRGSPVRTCRDLDPSNVLIPSYSSCVVVVVVKLVALKLV